MALSHLGHLRRELGFGDEATLDEHGAQRMGRALEVLQRVIALAEVFGRAPQLVQAHDLAAGQRVAQRVRLLLPELHAVIDGIDRAAGLPAHVVRSLLGHEGRLSTEMWGRNFYSSLCGFGDTLIEGSPLLLMAHGALDWKAQTDPQEPRAGSCSGWPIFPSS